MDLSVVVPIKDERDNLGPLHERVAVALQQLVQGAGSPGHQGRTQ